MHIGTSDDLYVKGAALYKAGQIQEAEQLFRRIWEALPRSDGVARGRAAYSLALCLIEQSRMDRAREALLTALEEDPTLDRARVRLKKLDEQHAQAPAPTTRGGVVGVVHGVRQGSEPDPMFGRQTNPYIRFRLELSTPIHGMPAAPTVELRGGRILGTVQEGDMVEVPGPWRPGQRSPFVLNLTTGET